MGKLSRQHMKQAIDRHQWSQEGQKGDAFITMGMYMCEVVLANEFGFGKKRLQRLEKMVLEMARTDFVAGAARFSKERSNNVEHGFSQLGRRLEQIHGAGHCDWMKSINWGKLP